MVIKSFVLSQRGYIVALTDSGEVWRQRRTEGAGMQYAWEKIDTDTLDARILQIDVDHEDTPVVLTTAGLFKAVPRVSGMFAGPQRWEAVAGPGDEEQAP